LIPSPEDTISRHISFSSLGTNHVDDQKHPSSLSQIYMLPGAVFLEPFLSEERSTCSVIDKDKNRIFR
jgi:hypothetical protein